MLLLTVVGWFSRVSLACRLVSIRKLIVSSFSSNQSWCFLLEKLIVSSAALVNGLQLKLDLQVLQGVFRRLLCSFQQFVGSSACHSQIGGVVYCLGTFWVVSGSGVWHGSGDEDVCFVSGSRQDIVEYVPVL